MRKIFVVAMLIATTGAHWALLQSVAWTTMIANNLCTESVAQSMTDTFDGNHPCPLCKAIAAGKKSEKKADISASSQKLEFPPPAEQINLIAPANFNSSPSISLFAEPLFQKPLLQPPRHLFV